MALLSQVVVAAREGGDDGAGLFDDPHQALPKESATSGDRHPAPIPPTPVIETCVRHGRRLTVDSANGEAAPWVMTTRVLPPLARARPSYTSARASAKLNTIAQ